MTKVMFLPLEYGFSAKFLSLNHVSTIENSSSTAVFVFGIFCAFFKDYRFGTLAFDTASGPGIGCLERVLHGAEEFQCSARSQVRSHFDPQRALRPDPQSHVHQSSFVLLCRPDAPFQLGGIPGVAGTCPGLRCQDQG